MQNQQPFTEYFEAIDPESNKKPTIHRCLNANDEQCKFPECKCLDNKEQKEIKQTEVAWHPV